MQSRTAHFRRQHQEILDTARVISGTLSVDASERVGADELHRALSRLAGQLSVHLAMEDEGLYPRLLVHRDSRLRNLAARYQSEMGGLRDTFTRYINKWSSAAQIANNAPVFEEETRALLDALSKRIEREDNELYALIDTTDPR